MPVAGESDAVGCAEHPKQHIPAGKVLEPVESRRPFVRTSPALRIGVCRLYVTYGEVARTPMCAGCNLRHGSFGIHVLLDPPGGDVPTELPQVFVEAEFSVSGCCGEGSDAKLESRSKRWSSVHALSWTCVEEATALEPERQMGAPCG